MERDFSIFGNNGEQIYRIVCSKEGENVITNRNWAMPLDKYKIRPIIRFHQLLNMRTKDYYYWLPVNGDYPKTLPPFPKTIRNNHE